MVERVLSGVLVACGCDVSASVISPSFKIMSEALLFLSFSRVSLLLLFVALPQILAIVSSKSVSTFLFPPPPPLEGSVVVVAAAAVAAFIVGWLLSKKKKRECCYEIRPRGAFAIICPNATHHTPSYTCPSSSSTPLPLPLLPLLLE